MKINKKIIKELSDYLDEFNLTELEYTEKDTKIKVSKNNFSVSHEPQIVSPSSPVTSSTSSQTQNVKSGTEILNVPFPVASTKSPFTRSGKEFARRILFELTRLT